MATLSVFNYNNLSPVLNMKVNNQSSGSNVAGSVNNLSKTFNKITVQNVLIESNGNTLNITKGNPNAIVRKIKDFGMIGTVNNATGAASLNMNPRKRPLMEAKQNQKPAEHKANLSASSRKPKLTKEERTAIRLAKKAAKENSNLAKAATKDQALTRLQHVKIPGTPGRKGLPLPQAVARRNARERNRVKQVNNGFAALRERIPEEVAEVFENQGTNRGSGKKLSKVETLRMAVEYIRSLERLLGFDFPVGAAQHNSSSGEESFNLIKDEFDAYSPAMDEHCDDSLSHYDNEEFFSSNLGIQQQAEFSSPSPQSQPIEQMDMLPNITTLNGLQYIRIPGTNTYQLLTPDIFVGSASSPPSSTIDEENFNALIDTNCVSSSLSSPPAILQQQQTNTADQQSPSPSLINSTEVIGRVQERAPVLTTTTTTSRENTNEGSATLSLSSSSSSSSSSTSLLLSPVPQNQQQQIIPLLTATSSPSSSPVLHQQQQQQQQQQQLSTLSPATTNDQHHQQQLHQGLRQTCAANQLQQQEFLLPNSTDQQIGTLHVIKQEYEEPSSNIYQQTSPPHQQQQQQHLQLYHSAMSPPLEGRTPTATSTVSSSSSNHIMQTLFPHDQNTSSFYEGVVTLKKEFHEVLLDASHATNVLPDESMIEAIDWWDAHTPKSDGGTLMM